MKLLDSYIIAESLKLMSIGTLIVLGVFFGTVEFEHVMQFLSLVGLPPNTVLAVMALQIPTGATYCLPAAVLMATMMILVQQHRDNEILALQISGVSPMRIMLPYLLMGLVATGTAFVVSEKVAPQARLLSQKLFLLGIYKTHRPFPSKQTVYLPDETNTNQILAFGGGTGHVIDGFLSIDLSLPDRVTVISAQKGVWQKGGWLLTKGNLLQLLNTDGSAGAHAKFEEMKLMATAGLAEQILEPPTSELDKTTTQLKQEIDTLARQHKQVPSALQFLYYRRFSHPWSCFLLVLAAAPLMLIRRKHRVDLSFVYGAALVVGFFVMQQVCLSLCENERLNPVIGAWLPALTLCSVGFALTLLLRFVHDNRTRPTVRDA